MADVTILAIDDSPTILKVVQLVLTKAGYRVIPASDGDEGIKMAQSENPQLILLDFIMPNLNGYQVCQTLHQDPNLKNIPVILMSAKGDQVGERFVKVMGIVDYITKPFSPEALLSVVQHSLSKYHSLLEADENQPNAMSHQPPDPIALVSAAESSLDRQRAALANFQERLCQTAAKALLDDAVSIDEMDELQLVSRLSRGITPEYLNLLLGELRIAAPELMSEQQTALAGDLRLVPLAEVLLLLSEQEQNGILGIHRGNAHIELYFEKGKIMLGRATGLPDELLLGRFILETRVIGKEDLEAFLQNQSVPASLLGAQLVKMGYLTTEELKMAIRQQTCELVYDLLRWRSGKFAFHPASDLAPVAAEAALNLNVESILMEGFRRVDEWHLIERDIDNFDLIFVRNDEAIEQMDRSRLTREELVILELVNSKNTIKDIIRQSRMSSFEVGKMLYRLHSIKLIRKRVPAMAT